MKKYICTFLPVLIIMVGAPLLLSAQESEDFTIIKKHKATPVEDQYLSSTCWAFAGTSFIESELIRTGKGVYDLSEVFIVRNAYIDKAEKYVRLHGKLSFSGGGEYNDVFDMIKKYGIVPESIYPGMIEGEQHHNHKEIHDVLKAYVDAVVIDEDEENELMMRDEITMAWNKAFEATLNGYFGNFPDEFNYNDKKYTPGSFAQSLELNWDDYVFLTSFTHHPYYKPFILELPDNWSWGAYYNIKIDELMDVMEKAIMNGYTFGWGGDVSEDGFSWSNGIARFDKTVEVTPEMRQDAFDFYKTTDDHGMHVIGLAEDDEGVKYFLAKNSWGVNNNYNGYLYLSKNFIKFKTIAIVVHKDAIPKKVLKKIGL